MESLQQSFEELKSRLSQRDRLDQGGNDPVFYLIFHPSLMLPVKRCLRGWRARLELDGWTVHTLSMVDAIHQILKPHRLRTIWLEGEKAAPLDFGEINRTLADALTAEGALERIIDARLQSIAEREGALLFLTDLEALHPYLRVGTLEGRLQGRFTVPTVILYPGRRTGRNGLRFLAIYPEDGNYRSTHIGGFDHDGNPGSI